MSTSITSLSRAERQAGRGLHAALWIAQILLALLFGTAGILKSTTPLPVLAQKLAWTASVPGPLVRFIGVAELAGVLGLLLPALTRVRPALTPLAAAGLLTVMILAIAFHVSRGEAGLIGMPVVLGALAAFVAWGRYRGAPIPARSR